MSPRPLPKIFLKHDWKRDLGSEDDQRPQGQVVQQSRSFQSNQPIRNPLFAQSVLFILLHTPPTQTSLLKAGMGMNPCATPQGGLLCGRVAEQSPLTGYAPKSLIESSSEHTPVNFPSRKSSFNTDFNDLATKVAVSEVTDTMKWDS